MPEKRNIENLIKISSDNLSRLVDVNTVIGKPILTKSGLQLIPYTKVTVGNIVGSGEYGESKIVDDDNTKAGASGLLINIKPLGFLVDDGKTCRLLNVTDNPTGELIEKASEFLADLVQKNE